MTIARDGRLLDVALLKSSGFPNLDNAVVETIRQASPFAPLPADLAQEQKTFIVPVNYTREH
jgi:protein TonB